MRFIINIGLIFQLLLIPKISLGDLIPEGLQIENYPAKTKLEAYFKNHSNQKNKNPSLSNKFLPGFIIDNTNDETIKNLFQENWIYRDTTYEIISSQRNSLGGKVYGLAIFAKDIKPIIKIEQFIKGVEGFHYSVKQIIEWANNLSQITKNFHPNTSEEEKLLSRLLEDKVILKKQNSYISGAEIKHVVGASYGKNRDVSLNLNHERIHILWDQNDKFRKYYITKWQELSDNEKQLIYQKFKNYNFSNETLIIEEWAVRYNENQPLNYILKERR